MKITLSSLLVSGALLAGSSLPGVVTIYDPIDVPVPGVGFNDSSSVGVWFNAITGDVLVNFDETNFPLLEDGRYQLRLNTAFFGNPAQILTQGFFSNGNRTAVSQGVPGFDDGTPLRFAAGDAIGAADFSVSGFVNLSGIFGLWDEDISLSGEPGYLGLQFPINGALHYGWAEVVIDYDVFGVTNGLTLTRFAFNDVPGAPVVAGAGDVTVPVGVRVIPEPSALSLMGLGALALLVASRRRS